MEEGIDDYPTLRQSVAKAEGDDAVITLYNTDNKTVIIPDYFTLVLAEDKDYAQYDNRFASTITNGATVTKSVYDYDEEDYVDGEITLASASGDDLTIYGATGTGIYPLTITEVDSKDKFGAITLNLTAVIRDAVPVPEVLDTDIYYSRYQSLSDINITEGWQFDNPGICPKNTYDGTYDISYKCVDETTEENWETLYDMSALDTAGIAYSYDAASNSIKAAIPVTVLESDTSPRALYITVYNDDTKKPIEGAYVSCDYEDEFPDTNGHYTDENGRVYAELSPGKRTLHVSAAGYTDEDGKTVEAVKDETFEILSSGTNAPEVYLVPVRTAVTLPIVHDRDLKTRVPGDIVSVTRLNGEGELEAKAWNGGSKSLTADGGTAVTLPDGRYMIKNATYGYSSDDKAFIKVENGTFAYYTDSACNVLADNQEAEAILDATKLTEPRYYVEVDKAQNDPTVYTAKVTVSNIKATYGTFGLTWDPDIFDLESEDNVILGTEIDVVETAEERYGKTWSKDSGQYLFVWTPKVNDEGTNPEAELDAETEAKEIAIFSFKLKGGNTELADMITVDSIGIEPWQDNTAARAWLKEKKKTNPDFDPEFETYFRYTDQDNSKNSLKEGRIEESKAAVVVSDSTPITSTIETRGFFEASVNGDLGNSEAARFYDIMTEIHYKFPIKNSVLRFHVYDRDDESDLENAFVRLFDTGVKLFDSDYTDYLGKTRFSVNTAPAETTDFTYDVALNGYWPLPESGLLSDRPLVTARTAKATEVEVPLEKKIYHEPIIKGRGEQTVELIGAADLGGEKYAYNGREFHFRIKGAKGFRIKEYPKYAYVTIGRQDEVGSATYVENYPVEVDSSGLFTLPKEKLNQPALTKEYMETLFDDDGDAEYPGVEDQPDAEGYRSYNVYIQFDAFTVEELDYIVEGMTNEGGYVKYDPAVPKANGVAAEVISPDEDKPSYIKVKTQKAVKDAETGETITESNHQTGTFTFTAIDDYEIEKVYINGLQINTYNGEKSFTYTFGKVDMDCSIAVLFWDGEHPSTDKVMTIVVGDYGFADVTSPVSATGDDALMCTRRTYLNPTKNLEFTTRPAGDAYKLYKVERELEGEARVPVTNSDPDYKYSFAPVESKSVTVYVTFRNENASITPNLFVKSYVFDGKGVVDPAGILIYTMYDTVEIFDEADAANSWKIKGEMLSPYEDYDNEEKMTEYDFPTLADSATYRYDKLMESMAIGAIFVEKTYKVEGYIDLGQRANLSDAIGPKTGAAVTFVRLNEDGTENKKKASFKTVSTAVRHDSVFTIDLPAGKWNVYVQKPGYVTYEITGFELFVPDPEDKVTYFANKQTIVPFIGSTREGKTITLQDAANVKSGLRPGVNATVFNQADVDNDGQVLALDLAYVWHNFNEFIITQEYSDFETRGSYMVDEATNP